MKNLFYLAASIVLFAACSTEEQPAPKLTLSAPYTADGQVKLIIPQKDSIIAVSNLQNGAASFDLPTNFPQMLGITIQGVQQPIYFYADVTDMNIEVDTKAVPPFFEISGSVYNDSLEAFSDVQNSHQSELQNMRPMWEEAVAANDSLTQWIITQKADSINTHLNEYTKKFAVRNGIMGTMIAQRFIYDLDFTLMQEVYSEVPVRYKNAPDVVTFKERMDIVEKTQIGKRFIDITQADTTGQQISISNVEGDLVLIDFWASWCGPCRMANPELVKIYNEFKDKGFNIVGVSLDQDGTQWKKAIVDDKLAWPQMSDLKGWQNEGAAAYAIRAIPQSVIIDDQKFIVAKNLTPEELRAFLTDKLN